MPKIKGDLTHCAPDLRSQCARVPITPRKKATYFLRPEKCPKDFVFQEVLKGHLTLRLPAELNDGHGFRKITILF